jgi:hypothetical protein
MPFSLRATVAKARHTALRAVRLTRARLRSALKGIYRNYISKSAVAITVQKSATVEGSAGVAIVALYPRGPLLASVNRLISTLVKEHYLVIAVVNKSPHASAWIAALSELNIIVLSRPNIGRDFGAYKSGYLFAEREGLLANAQHLIFANDSVYYGPRSQEFLANVLRVEHPWAAMFVNHHIYTHAQSFFVRFSSELFTLPDFKKFWHNYYVSDSREHAIHQGERKLSKILLVLGKVPYSYVDADQILSNSLFGDFTEYEKHNIRRFSGAAATTQISVDSRVIEVFMRAQFPTRNITHAQGTLASRVLGAPLKLDLGPIATQEALRDTLLALGSSADETHAVLEFMLKPPAQRVPRATVSTERPSLHELMSRLHRTLEPRTYLEVGVFQGSSLKLANCPAVGIDPAPKVTQPLPATAQVIATTGDDFFAQPRPLERVFNDAAPHRSDGERFAELALIDGMHHAEFALRDFMNIERNSAPWSVIVFDDTLPENHEQALRARATEAWTGDVFRVEQVLKRYRPDLVTVRIDIYTGALLVFAPNHLDQRLTNSYDQIVAEYVQPDPQVVPDEVLQRTGAISIETLTRSGVLEVVRTARERGATSEWVAREVRARLSGK